MATEAEQFENVDLGSLSDEQIESLNPASLEESNANSESQAAESEEGREEEVRGGVEEHPPESETKAAEETDEEVDEPQDIADFYYEKGSKQSAEPAEETEITDEDVAEAEAEAEAEDDAEIDYKAAYEEFLAPFKAAGREVRVTNPEDARRLMQMGVDYSRKMEQLKPHLKAIKALEKNGLLDQEQINFVVDLVSKKNPAAIQKFLKDSEVDPLDLSMDEEASDYKPNSYTPTDAEMELETVLDDIRETNQFQRTVEIITDDWDQRSKEVIVKNPTMIKSINDHVGMGIYDQIWNVVEQERMFGRLQGMSDLEAYKAVGDAINAKGGFKPYQKQGTSQANTSQVPGSSSKRDAQDEQLRKRKRAAGTTRTTGGKSKEVTNFLASLSDEEIEKMGPAIL